MESFKKEGDKIADAPLTKENPAAALKLLDALVLAHITGETGFTARRARVTVPAAWPT